jgi:hypothetical protein
MGHTDVIGGRLMGVLKGNRVPICDLPRQGSKCPLSLPLLPVFSRVGKNSCMQS